MADETLKSNQPWQGWECPKCEAVMSPAQQSCVYCKPKEQKEGLESYFLSIPNVIKY